MLGDISQVDICCFLIAFNFFLLIPLTIQHFNQVDVCCLILVILILNPSQLVTAQDLVLVILILPIPSFPQAGRQAATGSKQQAQTDGEEDDGEHESIIPARAAFSNADEQFEQFQETSSSFCLS